MLAFSTLGLLLGLASIVNGGIKAKNLELADMIRERDRARFDLDRQKASHKDEIDRLKREIRFANERAEDATRSRSSEVSGVLAKYNRQMNELEESLRVRQLSAILLAWF